VAAAADLQAQQRLLDLAFTILKRFGEGQAPNSSAAAAADTLAVPGGVPRAGAGAAAGAAAGGSGRPTAAAAGAAASGGAASSTWSESLGFAPLVVATLKVRRPRCQLGMWVAALLEGACMAGEEAEGDG
jgi:hypothetical protein